MSACKVRCLPATAASLAVLFLAASASAQAPRVVQAADSAAGGVARGIQAAGRAITGLNNKVEKHFTVAGRPVVTVQNPMGRIQVKAWDRHEVLVIATHSSTRVQTSAEQVGDRIEITSTEVSGAAAAADDDLEANYEINVPTESELQVHTDSGNVTVESVHGDMSFDTVTGDLALQDVQGYILIKSIGGSLVCTRCAGRIDATSISGNFQLVQPMMDNVRLQTSSGNILFDGNFLDRGIYVLHNYSGTIEVRFSAKDSIDVRAASLYGNVINEAPVVPDKHRLRLSSPSPATPGVANSLFGSLNQGQAEVELSSFSGTIKILKRIF